jgi:hypothetical protein
VENGIVVDPSGYGIATTGAASSMSESHSAGSSASGSSGGGGCFISKLKN